MDFAPWTGHCFKWCKPILGYYEINNNNNSSHSKSYSGQSSIYDIVREFFFRGVITKKNTKYTFFGILKINNCSSVCFSSYIIIFFSLTWLVSFALWIIYSVFIGQNCIAQKIYQLCSTSLCNTWPSETWALSVGKLPLHNFLVEGQRYAITLTNRSFCGNYVQFSLLSSPSHNLLQVTPLLWIIVGSDF